VSWQSIAVVLVVALALAYLVWKLGFAGGAGPKKKRGPDVPAKKLVRKK
jgi:hypothetical protein